MITAIIDRQTNKKVIISQTMHTANFILLLLIMLPHTKSVYQEKKTNKKVSKGIFCMTWCYFSKKNSIVVDVHYRL